MILLLSHLASMPSHGVEIIDGIPVVLKDNVMYAFQHQAPSPTQIRLGSYNPLTKKATWDAPDALNAWVESYQASLGSRSRK